MTPRPADALTRRSTRLYVDDCAVTDLVERYGSPLFVISETRLRSNARRFVRAFGHAWPGPRVEVLPSIKANFVLAVRRILTQEGLGCDTFGPGEFHAARATGVPPHLVSVNGAIKDIALIRDAIEYGACITLDSERECAIVEQQARAIGTRVRVRVRVRPDYSSLTQPSDLDEGGATVAELAGRYKPGIPRDALVGVCRRLLAAEEIDLCGLMAHVGRHRADVDFWRAAMASFGTVVAQVRDELDWEPPELDIGGGFATPRDPTGRRGTHTVNHDGVPLAPGIESYADTVCGALAEELERQGIDPAAKTLLLEPGRSLLSDTGVHATTVCNVKTETVPRPRHWVETDTTEMFFPDSLTERYGLVPLNASSAAPDGTQVLADVVGKSCQFDILAPDVRMSLPACGDVLVFADTGAYLETSASNFNALPRPGTVLVNGAGHELVKRPETVADVFARDIVPARLVGGGR